MKLTAWRKQRVRLQEEYDQLVAEGRRLVLAYDQGQVEYRALVAHVRRLYRARLEVRDAQ